MKFTTTETYRSKRSSRQPTMSAEEAAAATAGGAGGAAAGATGAADGSEADAGAAGADDGSHAAAAAAAIAVGAATIAVGNTHTRMDTHWPGHTHTRMDATADVRRLQKFRYLESLARRSECGMCGHDPARKKCGRCMAIRYCSKSCQVQHWPVHKTSCVREN
jgi:hypothetical protein